VNWCIDLNTTLKLKSYLVENFPELADYYYDYKEEWEEEPQNEYAVFSRIVKPYIEMLFEEGRESDLKDIWAGIEHIASQWGDPARNEIHVVTTEEIELCKHYKYLGPTLVERWIVSIVWYPEFNNMCLPINRHIDKEAYRNRWIEEIAGIGGFESLTTSKEAEIFKNLKSEFKVQSNVPT